MPIYEVTDKEILPVEETTFNFVGLQERRDLQRLLRDHIEVIAPETLLISEEFDEWEDAKRRIDLLAIDKNANLVAIELKRTEDGGFMELQCIRYTRGIATAQRSFLPTSLARHAQRHAGPYRTCPLSMWANPARAHCVPTIPQGQRHQSNIPRPCARIDPG
jgi:hypothetical protein